eukprot:6185525-Pleurochrysis_carterae.AAC.1
MASAASSSTMTPMEAQVASPDSQPSPLYPPSPKMRDRMPNVPIMNPNKRKAIAARAGAQQVFRNC